MLKASGRGLATRVLEITAGEGDAPSVVRNFPGSYADYAWRIEKEKAAALEAAAPLQPATSAAAQSERQPAACAERPALSYKEEKQIKAARRKMEREEQRLLLEIDELEKKIAALQEELNLPEVYGNRERAQAVQAQIEECREGAEELTRKWEELSARLSEFGSLSLRDITKN